MGEGNSRLISNGILKEELFQPHFFIIVFENMELPPLQHSGVSYHPIAPQAGLGAAKPTGAFHAHRRVLQGCDNQNERHLCLSVLLLATLSFLFCQRSVVLRLRYFVF